MAMESYMTTKGGCCTDRAPTAEEFDRMLREIRPLTKAERLAMDERTEWSNWLKGLEQRRRAKCHL